MDAAGRIPGVGHFRGTQGKSRAGAAHPLCLEQLGQGPKSKPSSCIPGREHMQQGWTEGDWPWVKGGDTEVHRCLFP